MRPPKTIYFMKPVGMAGPVKIGCSRWPADRLRDIETWSPFPLELIAAGVGCHRLEFFIHRRFEHLRSHREWFHISDDLLACIERVKSGASVADAFGAVPIIRRAKYEAAASLKGYRPTDARAAA